MTTASTPRSGTAQPVEAPRGLWSMALERLLRNKLAMLGLALVLILAVVAIFAPLIATFDPAKQHFDAISQGPSGAYILGTDQLGRDTFSRLVYGARTSLMVGVFAQIVALAIGVTVGVLAGFFADRVDNWLMRGVDVVYAFPDLLLIILLRSVLGGGIFMLFLTIGLYSWTNIARLVRAQVLSARETDYVLAARALGARDHGIMVRHVLPNVMGPIIVASTFAVPRAIFVEAALSYIGLGVNPPTSSWGTMIQDGYSIIFTAPHLVLFPALAIGMIMLAFTFLGDGLRDALDPRLSR